MGEIDLVDILEGNDLTEVEVIKSNENYSVIRFCYDFDQEEMAAAKAYASGESEEEEGSNEWYENWYTPYLYDVAKDNIQEIIEEICDDFELEGEFKEAERYNLSKEFMKGIIIFCKDSSEIEMEDIINDYI